MKERIPIKLDADWQQHYRNMIQSADEAVAHIQPGQRIFLGTGCTLPQELIGALVRRGEELADVEIVQLLSMGEAPFARQELHSNFRVNSFFIVENVREVIQQGLGDYTPVSFFDIPKLFLSGQILLDVALIQMTPPDEKGICNLGISVDVVKSAIENASLVIAQVNPQMPWTMGNSSINIHDVDILVPVDAPLLEMEPPIITETDRHIGMLVASLVEDGSTIELGAGRMPQATVEFLHSKKNLGIHTEMVTDAIIDLIQSGAVNNASKAIDRGKIVVSFCAGTKKLYDFVDQNPMFSFRPTEYVNDPWVISKNPNMVAIDTALEVDLTGQVCADSLGSRFYSGIGSRINFNQGAARSDGGKSIIALPSTAKNGTVSRIVTRLSAGAGVSISRADVHYVVTEHGVAYLFGKTVQERTLALISIAHPDFRAQLFREAIEAKYLRSELGDVEGKIHVGSPQLSTSLILEDGTMVHFRPVHPTDEPRMKDLFYALSKQSIYYRWMSHLKRIPREEIQNYVYIDHRNQMAIVATLPESHGEDIIAVGGYYLDPKTNRAEVAFTVRDSWQKRGIGTFLLKYLMRIAKRNGIAGFVAEVLSENKPMQKVFNKSDCRVNCHLVEGVYTFELNFED